MSTLVMKFGGTSVGSPDAIIQTAKIILANKTNWENLVVVVSAMTGVTNALIQTAVSAAKGNETTYQKTIADLKTRHHETIEVILSDDAEKLELQKIIDQHLTELSAYCRSIHVLGEVTDRGMDTIVSLGERMNARIVSAVIRQNGSPSQPINATELIVTDNQFQNAAPLMEKTCKGIQSQLTPLLRQGIIPIVTGFIGANEEGIITTLGRGGSDYTAAILGDCLNADEVWTWTDVNGVMTADPRVVANAKVIPELSFNEVSELAYFGAKVLHPKTIRPVMERNIPLRVKNTFNPTHPGTRITFEPNLQKGNVTAITTIKELSMVTVEGRGMMGVPGIAARTFSAVARVGASVLMISQASSEQSICFVIPTATVPDVIQSIEDEMSLELARKDIDRVWSMDDVVIVTAVGAGLRNTPGISGKIFSALGRNQINAIAIAQGSSEYSISIVVDENDADQAVIHIHSDVILGNGGDL